MATLKRITYVILAGAVLAACAAQQKAGPDGDTQAGTQAAAETKAKPEKAVFNPTPGLSPRARLRKAIRLLEVGQAPQARAELGAYLQEIPNSNIARGLLAQIETPMAKYFPAESFTVTLAGGDSLSTLAKAYLGDALEFYALSRYNGIDNPSQVKTGQDIRIPATQRARAARESARMAPAAPPSSPEPAAAAATLADKPKAEPDPRRKASISVPQPKPKPAPTLTGWAKINALTEAGDHKGAAAELDSMGGGAVVNAARAARIYLAGAKQLGRGDARRASHFSLQAGRLYLNELNDPDRAITALELSTSLDESNSEAEELLARAQASAIDRSYRAGLEAYRRQDLDTAIANWDRVLEIDPEHTNASLYRVQALKLKERLSKM
ncbi:MAG: LysM peptidoglycan-binding domain-containing protein [Alphaproteobacteria bacterium]|nr:LysM peptidoglycan-binding domain-containing protein [Alphaproteobacteria bacterium]